MLYGWWNKAEFPFQSFKKEDYPNSITQLRNHELKLYVEKFIDNRNSIERDFPITYYSVRNILNKLVVEGFVENIEELIKLKHFHELFYDEFKRIYFYQDIADELDVDFLKVELELMIN